MRKTCSCRPVCSLSGKSLVVALGVRVIFIIRKKAKAGGGVADLAVRRLKGRRMPVVECAMKYVQNLQ